MIRKHTVEYIISRSTHYALRPTLPVGSAAGIIEFSNLFIDFLLAVGIIRTISMDGGYDRKRGDFLVDITCKYVFYS